MGLTPLVHLSTYPMYPISKILVQVPITCLLLTKLQGVTLTFTATDKYVGCGILDSNWSVLSLVSLVSLVCTGCIHSYNTWWSHIQLYTLNITLKL